MPELQGLGASPGWAAAPARRLGGRLRALPPLPPAESPVEEAEAARDALAAVAGDLRTRAQAATEVGRDVLEALAALVEDPALAGEVERRIGAHEPAAAATWHAFEGFAAQLQAIGGAFAERADDLLDLRARVAGRLLGLPDTQLELNGTPWMLVAEALAPADAAALDPSVVGIVTETGSPTSHTAIVARSLGIPAVVACRGALGAIADGVLVAVDGDSGEVVVDPAPALIEQRRRRAEAAARAAAAITGEGRTADGHPVALLVNAAGPADVAALEDGCAGVGLLRTELLFLDRAHAPSVDEQASAYRAILERLEGRSATIRTLDAGSDKLLAFANDADEENPALGVRGLRVDRIHPELLDDQLAAIVAAADGLDVELKVMAPMVSTVAEAQAFVARARRHGIERAGVMVEVPALALCARAGRRGGLHLHRLQRPGPVHPRRLPDPRRAR
jgi:phosphotransferase system enzyme I (PtsI)